MPRGVLAFVLLSLACAKELTKETWDEAVSGKTNQPEEFEGSDSVLIADVDCTGGGKSKCDEVGVKGFPTLKYGDPDDLQDYNGGRSFADLQKFAQGLGPTCSPANRDLCDDEKKKLIDEYLAMDASKRDSMIKEKEAEIEKLESDFKKFVEGLQKQYQESSDKKDKDVEAVKSSGLGLLKAVSAFQKKAKSEL
eukprot:Skav224115  [mRNA]  locus=scaffold2427:179452:180261:- [translate_table: standard]